MTDTLIFKPEPELDKAKRFDLETNRKLVCSYEYRGTKRGVEFVPNQITLTGTNNQYVAAYGIEGALDPDFDIYADDHKWTGLTAYYDPDNMDLPLSPNFSTNYIEKSEMPNWLAELIEPFVGKDK